MTQIHLATVRDCSESLFDHIYVNLQAKAAKENEALYQTAIAKCKTAKQRAKKAGYYCGNWQKLFDAWCHGKIANTYALDFLNKDYVTDELLVTLL